MQSVYDSIEEYNPRKKRKVLIVFDDMIPDIISNKKCHLIVTELFIRGRMLNNSNVFISQSYYKKLRNVRLNTIHFFIMKIQNRQEV